MANFDLTNLAVKMICPNNVVKTDDTDLPSVLVYIPKFKNSDVLTGGNDSTHPAFIVNGVEIPGFYYGKYQAKVYNSVAYSLPGEDPTASINFDTARARCEAKGAGWHLSTNAEWAAIALWCKKNGFLPYGNNNYGKDSRESNYKAVPSYYESNKIARVATGTGPISWSHDKTMAGIWDLNGNVWEWQGGIRLVWGELQILANNDAADPDNTQNATSTCWKAINAADGALVDPESKTTDSSAHVSGKTVKLDYVNNKWTYSTSITNAKDESRSCAFYQVLLTARSETLPRLCCVLSPFSLTLTSLRTYTRATTCGVITAKPSAACIAGAPGATVRTLVCSASTATPAALRTRPSASVPLAFGLSATLTLWTIWTLTRSSQNRKSAAF